MVLGAASGGAGGPATFGLGPNAIPLDGPAPRAGSTVVRASAGSMAGTIVLFASRRTDAGAGLDRGAGAGLDRGAGAQPASIMGDAGDAGDAGNVGGTAEPCRENASAGSCLVTISSGGSALSRPGGAFRTMFAARSGTIFCVAAASDTSGSGSSPVIATTAIPSRSSQGAVTAVHSWGIACPST
jgi:hypothetical protein